MSNKNELMFGIWNNRTRDNDRNRDRDRDECGPQGLFSSACFSENETSEDVFNF
ncbi:hypothetical protein [Vibrio brasiliensis]|uniref:hypothetical protein n=1 Tax=Vibrio brasiliensis TaxID=170652 RepID=UPI001EFD0F43|nr:hypothetical protein [Vibrio brasiliensis]MCG9724114.1 hypothetical protein [Vibrio brasiliensis]